MILVLALLLCCPARAADDNEELAEALGVDKVEAAAEDTGLSDYGSILYGYDAEGYLSDLALQTVKAVVSPGVFRSISAVLMTVLLLAAVRTVAPPNEGFDAAALAGSSAVLLLLGASQDGMTAMAEASLLKLQDVANALLPVLGSAALLSGQVTAAAAKYSAAALFLNALVNLCCSFVLPLIRLYLAAAAAEAAVGSGVMSSVLGFLKWCGTTALTCLMLGFTLYLSLTAMAANTADAAVVRSAKTTVAATLPVVGSIAGDAASSLLSAAAVIRQSLGSFGLLAVAGVLLTPFLQTGLRYLLLKGVSAVSAELAEGRISRLLGRLSDGMALLMGCIGSGALMLFFSVYSFLKTSIS